MLPWRTEDMTPQQRANWALLQSVLEQEFERGFKRGLEVRLGVEVKMDGLDESKLDPQTEGVLFMHTQPAEGPEKAIDIPRTVL